METSPACSVVQPFCLLHARPGGTLNRFARLSETATAPISNQRSVRDALQLHGAVNAIALGIGATQVTETQLND